MTQKMVCPPSPLGYTKYERRYYAGDWWYRVSPSSPWQLCVEDGDDDTSNDERGVTYFKSVGLLVSPEFAKHLVAEGDVTLEKPE